MTAAESFQKDQPTFRFSSGATSLSVAWSSPFGTRAHPLDAELTVEGEAAASGELRGKAGGLHG
jgi:hypothetical protein